MMTRLIHGLAWVCVFITLAVAGLVVTALATGKLTGPHLAQIAQVLRDEPVTDAAPATQTPTSQPAQAASASAAHGEGAEVTQRLLSRQEEELAYKTRQLEDLRVQVQQEREELRQAQAVFDQRVQAATQQAQDAGFQAQVSLYQSMRAREAKDILMGMDDRLAAQFLRAMRPMSSRKIIEEFKTPDEQTRRQRLLDLMRSPL